MIKILVLMMIFSPLFLLAQIDPASGIHFSQELSWEQIKTKAKIERKFIFVDCYATWCGPCKKMDVEVYPDDSIGKFASNHFVSVKIQFDTSKKDNEIVKARYKTAHNLLAQFNVTTFPSFLFFSPSGQIVHRDVGYKNRKDFIHLLKLASDSTKQLYTLLSQYQLGVMNYQQMPYLANTVNSILKNKELADKIGQDYLHNYLYKYGDNVLLTKENILLIGKYVQSTEEKGFRVIFDNAEKVDHLVREGYAQSIIDFLITKDEIREKLYHDSKPNDLKPDWDDLKASILKKYNSSYADRLIIDAQIQWYLDKKQWPDLIKYNVMKIEKYGLDTIGLNYVFVNNMIFGVIFMHCNDTVILNKAIKWMEIIIRKHDHGDDIDTYANLLYKVGRIDDAILWETRGLIKEEELAKRLGQTPKKYFSETLEKMKRREPTCVEEGAVWDANTLPKK